MNNLVQSSLGMHASGSVGQFPEIEFLSQKVDAFKFSIDTAKLLSMRVEPTYSLASTKRFVKNLPTEYIFKALGVCQSESGISIVSAVEHLLHLRANCVSFSGNYLLETSACFLMDIGVCLLNSRSFVHTSEISPPPVVCVTQMHPRLSSDLV